MIKIKIDKKHINIQYIWGGLELFKVNFLHMPFRSCKLHVSSLLVQGCQTLMKRNKHIFFYLDQFNNNYLPFNLKNQPRRKI